MDGRVLAEALIDAEAFSTRPAMETVDETRRQGFLEWRQYLKFTHLGSAVYYDEGNGRSALKQTTFGSALAGKSIGAASGLLPPRSQNPRTTPSDGCMARKRQPVCWTQGPRGSSAR